MVVVLYYVNYILHTNHEQENPMEETRIKLSSYDEKIFPLLKESKIQFNLRIGLKTERRNVTLLDFFIPERKIVISGGEVVKLPEINEITFQGINAVKFYKELLPLFPASYEECSFFENKNLYIYPFGEKGFFQGKALKIYPYFFLLHITKKSRNSKKPTHIYKLKYKVFISAFSTYKPYPKELIEETGKIYDRVKPGSWREEAQEIGKLLKEILKDSKEGKVLTFALKDGREITGFFNRKKSWRPYRYPIYNPKGKQTIYIFKHAIDDLWEAE